MPELSFCTRKAGQTVRRAYFSLCACPAHKRHYYSAGHTDSGFTDRWCMIKWAGKCAVVLLLVGYYQRKQYEQRVEREHEQWQREQQQ